MISVTGEKYAGQCFRFPISQSVVTLPPMHWLENLDVALFHFINGSLGNPFFDWLMPILSGNGVKWFIPLVVIAGVTALCVGGARARLCALMIFLVVCLGDPLIVNTVKKSVERPRPCITLADTVERLGCTQTGSMPSAHAANWFAMTMVLFLFYRRSAWVMLPLALAVAFSRVYCGVHYPSDVLAGAILGAGYAIAFAITLETIWQKIGRRWFPYWHARLPALVPSLKFLQSKTETALPPSSPVQSDRQWLYLGYVLVALTLIGRWVYIASGKINLSKDEAYQWVWSKHLALSYYSKPPGIAFIQATSTSIFGDTEFGVRFFSPLFAAILSFVALRFFYREASAKLGFWLLLIVNAAPLMGLGTILMTIDSPLVLCWTMAIIFGWSAAQPDGRTRDWLLVGLAMGLGFLCKYSVLYQLFCWAIFFALWPPARIHLKKAGPWLALLIFLLCTTPIIIWNSQHDWITAHHVASNAGMESHWKPTLRYFWDYIFTEFALLNPVFSLASAISAFAFWKYRKQHPLWLFFFCMSWPVLIGHLLFSLHSRILPNWIAPAVPPMFCLMALYWNERLRAGARLIKPFLGAGLAIGFIAIAFMYDSNLIGKITGQLLPGEKDPSRRARAWVQTSELIENQREKLAAGGTNTFIIADHYGITSLFTFYSPEAQAALKTSKPLVYSTRNSKPDNQYYFWPEYDYATQRKGENAIFVTELETFPLESNWLWKWLKREPIAYAKENDAHQPQRMMDEFERVEDLGDFQIKVGNRVFRRIHLWACYNLK